MDRDAAPAEVDEAAVHLVPEPLDVERVLADQRVAQARRDRVRARRLDERPHELGRRVDLADPRDALVGVDADDEVVLAAVGDAVVHDRLAQDDGLDVGDLHGGSGLTGTVEAGTSRFARLSTIAKLSTIP